MSEWTYPIDTEHNIYPNITVRKKMRDDVFAGWRINSNEGYVFYDTTENNTEIDPETDDEISVIYYYTEADLTKYFNWNNFNYVAVLRSEVDENYIFGGGDNDHEVMGEKSETEINME